MTAHSPRGYYVEPETNDPNNPGTTALYTGDLNPDGSIIAGGRIIRGAGGDFWLRKFTATGAVATSFGNGAGFVRTLFYGDASQGSNSNSTPQVLKRQPDGEILFAGQCRSLSSHPTNGASFGDDVCLVRYNADGTLDQSFGNNPVTVGFAADHAHCGGSGQPPCTYTFSPGAGKFTMQTGRLDNCTTPFSFGVQIYAGTNGTIYDIVVQPNGKILLAGETTKRIAPFGTNCLASVRIVGILIRLNPNGSLDASFGANGIAKLVGPRIVLPEGAEFYGPVRFRKVLAQPDGRIIAAGYDGTVEGTNTATVFVVTRWTANGQLETKSRLDNNQSQAARETAVGALFNRDNTKLFVSGTYQNKQILARLNLVDLSLDQTFASGGIRQSNLFGALNIQAIQPDGKILAVDDASVNGSFAVRLNPDGSPD